VAGGVSRSCLVVPVSDFLWVDVTLSFKYPTAFAVGTTRQSRERLGGVVVDWLVVVWVIRLVLFGCFKIVIWGVK